MGTAAMTSFYGGANSEAQHIEPQPTAPGWPQPSKGSGSFRRTGPEDLHGIGDNLFCLPCFPWSEHNRATG